MTEPTVEEKAKNLGWAPKEEWRGDPERWVDAETFVRRGEEVLPIIKSNNKRLQEEISELRARDAARDAELKEYKESVEALTQFRKEIKEERKASKRAELAAALKVARENDDVDAELGVQEELSRLQSDEGDGKGKESSPPKKDEFKPDPRRMAEFDQWKSDNPWFTTDPIRASVANAIAAQLRSNPETKDLLGRPFLDRVTEGVEKYLGPTDGKGTVDRVAGGRPTGDGNGSRATRGKSYADLPPEAKEACDRDSKRLVGPNRAFKDENAWRAYYVKEYFEE